MTSRFSNNWNSDYYGGGLVQFDLTNNETKHYTKVNSNLPTLSVTSLFRDSENRLWVGLVDHGIIVISGEEWYNFDRNAHLLPSVVHDIKEDDNGLIWAIGNDTLCVFENEEWSIVETPVWDSDNDSFRYLQVLNKNKIWIGTRKNGLFQYDNGKWTHFTVDSSTGIDVREIYSMSHVDSTLWIVSDKYEIYAFQSDQWTDYSIPSEQFYQIIGINDSSFWALNHNRLLKRKGSDTTFYKPPSDLIGNYSLSSFVISDSGVYCANRDSIIFKLSNNSWSILTLEFENPMANYIWMTNFEDGNKWISTYDGLAYVSNDSIKWYNQNNSPLENRVRPNAIDQNGYIWVGTWDSGVHRLDRTTGEWESWVGEDFPLPNDAIREIAIDGNNNKWIGAWNGGFTIYNDDTWVSYTVANSDLPDPDVTTICHASDGSHWIGTFGGGVVHITNDNWQLYNTENSGLSGNDITKIAEHPDGSIWVGTNNNGVTYFNGTGWLPLEVSHPELLYNAIRDIDFTTNGHVWIATHESGILKYANNSFEYFHSGNSPLPINNVWTLDIGPDNTIWIGTWGNGLLSYSYDILATQEIDKSLPTQYILHQNYPNPFNPVTTINYDLYTQSDVTLAVYDIRGGLVTTLVNQNQSPGEKVVTWNLLNHADRPVSAGIYFYRLQINNRSETRKMIVIK